MGFRCLSFQSTAYFQGELVQKLFNNCLKAAGAIFLQLFQLKEKQRFVLHSKTKYSLHSNLAFLQLPRYDPRPACFILNPALRFIGGPVEQTSKNLILQRKEKKHTKILFSHQRTSGFSHYKQLNNIKRQTHHYFCNSQ